MGIMVSTAHYRLAILWLLTAITAAEGVFAGTATAAPSPALYTTAQAVQGKTLFQAQCAVCHGAHLEGLVGPPLKGPALTGQHRSVGSLFGFLSRNMPLSAPGSLTARQYVAIMAYLLRENGHPAGDRPLTYDMAKRSHVRM